MIKIKGKEISNNSPVYFIADIGANHDGNFNRAVDLICMAAESGADAVKFQHFEANTIVSDYGFRHLGKQLGHQSKWKKPVYEVYKDASINLEWTEGLKEVCDKQHVAFLSTPYSFEMVDHLNPYVEAFKIGSGDITYKKLIEYIAKKEKPVILSTGASYFCEVFDAYIWVIMNYHQLILMQCNTNYTNDTNNFKYVNLNVLKMYEKHCPNVVLGLSDHTPGDETVLGAIALGARVIEKHFTDDNNREGPDHKFAMNPDTWKKMVIRSRRLEEALGGQYKQVEENEEESVIIQRRCLTATKNIKKGTILNHEDITSLRPCPKFAIPPYDDHCILGLELLRDLKKGECIKWEDLESKDNE